MAEESSFRPNWASPPGATIIDILDEYEMSINQFSTNMEFAPKYARDLIKGRVSITAEIATQLEHVLGASTKFWLNRESQYREDLIRIQKRLCDNKDWLSKLPLSDMMKFGWIARSRIVVEKEKSCLRFFDVSNVDEWYKRYSDLLMKTSFRTSSSFDSQPESVISWLRQGEIEAEAFKSKPWNAQGLQKALLQVRKLTRNKSPQEFIPHLQSLLSECGVSVVIVPTPARCRASGATYFISPDRALLLLSFRHLSDDHFWFSLFHEAGHLLLHGNKSLFLEKVGECLTVEEQEANDFAAEMLIPAKYLPELKTLNAKNWRTIVRFSRKIGISTGIVVGQLQHMGIVNHNQLNKLKTRFKWEEIRA